MSQLADCVDVAASPHASSPSSWSWLRAWWKRVTCRSRSICSSAPGADLAGRRVGLVPGQPDRADLPGALPADTAAGLLDEVVLGQLAQVPGAVGGGLVEAVGELGRGQRAGDGEQLQYRSQAHRVGQGGQLAGVLETPVRGSGGRFLVGHRVESTLSKELLQYGSADSPRRFGRDLPGFTTKIAGCRGCRYGGLASRSSPRGGGVGELRTVVRPGDPAPRGVPA